MKFIQQFQWPFSQQYPAIPGEDAPSFHLMSQHGCAENDPNGPVARFCNIQWWDGGSPDMTGGFLRKLGCPFWIGIFDRIFHINHESWGIPHKTIQMEPPHMSLMFPLNINHSLTAKSPMKVKHLLVLWLLSHIIWQMSQVSLDSCSWCEFNCCHSHGWDIPVA